MLRNAKNASHIINNPTYLMFGGRCISNKNIWQMNKKIFFSNVGPKLAKDITNIYENIFTYDYLGSMIEKCLFLKPVDEEEVINTMKVCTKKNLQTENISMNIVAKVVSVKHCR